MPQTSSGLIGKYCLWIMLACVGRLWPHLPNATPLMALSVMAGMYIPLSQQSFAALIQALGVTFSSLFISDIVLHGIHHIPFIGSWTLFTYTGFLLITYFSYQYRNFFQRHLTRQCGLVFSASFFYWLWTNFGVWLAGYYSYTVHGLVMCYNQALPFLPQSLLGDLAWFIVLIIAIFIIKFSYFKLHMTYR